MVKECHFETEKTKKGYADPSLPFQCENFITHIHVGRNTSSLGLAREMLLVGLDSSLLLDLLEVQLRDGGVVAVDDLGELLEGGALGLDVHDVDEDELGSDPAL